MAFSVSEYLQLLLNLLPRGKAWTRDSDSNIYNLMHAHADELNRIDERSDELRQELDTRYTTELLTDHETDLGLPDECFTITQTIAQRRTNAHTKYIIEGGMHIQSYIDLADDLGYEIDVIEFKPAWSGVAAAGDPCGPQENIFYVQIQITLSPDDWIYFTCGESQCGDYLIEVADTSVLQCMLNKVKPGHVIFLYTYTGYEFTSAFSSAFNAIPASDQAYVAGAFDRAFGSAFDVYNGGGAFDYDEFDNSFSKPY